MDATAPVLDLFPAAERHDAGGSRLLPLPPGVQGSAVFGGERDCYRYRLAREWGDGPPVLFVMLNPSTADIRFDDPTVAKCGRFARRWGFGALWVGNTFAYRCTDQGRLTEVPDPIGPDNDRHLLEMARAAGLVVMAFGTPKVAALRPRGLAVARTLAGAGVPLRALRVSKANIPWHPLYLPDATDPAPWAP